MAQTAATFGVARDNFKDTYLIRKGLIIPDVIIASTPVQQPASIIYNRTDSSCYFSNGTAWVPFGSGIMTGSVPLVFGAGQNVDPANCVNITSIAFNSPMTYTKVGSVGAGTVSYVTCTFSLSAIVTAAGGTNYTQFIISSLPFTSAAFVTAGNLNGAFNYAETGDDTIIQTQAGVIGTMLSLGLTPSLTTGAAAVVFNLTSPLLADDQYGSGTFTYVAQRNTP